MKPYFLDTSYILALENTKDQYHQAVRQHWRSLATSSLTLCSQAGFRIHSQEI